MTKTELIEKMATDAKITKAAAGAALASFIDGVTKALRKKDGKVSLVEKLLNNGWTVMTIDNAVHVNCHLRQ